MEKDNCYLLGWIPRTHGIKGELILQLNVDNLNDYKKLAFVYVEVDNNLIRYEVEVIKINGEKVFAKFKGVDDMTAGEKLIKKSLYLPLELLPKLDDKHFYFHEIFGFTAIDTIDGEIGAVEKVLEFPAQSIIQIKTKNNKEVLVPIIPGCVQLVDRVKKTILLVLPEGLLQIYL